MQIKQALVFTLFLFAFHSLLGQQKLKQNQLEPEPGFSISHFITPQVKYAPFVRWWWPGNDVTQNELKREINLFAEHGFGGVEIQPLNIGLPISRENRERILSWDSPTYYENVRAVLEEAKKTGLTVDITNGSGWPPGGAHLVAEDGFLSLTHTDTVIIGGQLINLLLPKPVYKQVSPKLQAVIAAKVLRKTENDKTLTVRLDAASLQNLSANVHDSVSVNGLVKSRNVDEYYHVFNWNAPDGLWNIITFWTVPSGENTMIAATINQGPVVDHLDSAKVIKNYNHLFGERTGLAPYFGNPLRAIFNDSYEFKADRHYSPDFFTWFRQHRGYDIVPWLPANMQKGYNMVEFMNPHAEPYFSFSDEDWRLRYDYDQSIGELLGEHFFKVSLDFMEPKGLMHRTQPYGLNMDMMALAGMSSIPETESMNGSEGKLKITTSGAHLYNRPVIAAESVVYINKAYTTTPLMVRLAVDKLFAAGVNQIVYHGIPYRYFNEKLSDEGWYPFSSSFLTFVNFASNLGESNPYWKFQKEINEYVARTQYALRTGKAIADVLIYYPFLNFNGLTDNPEEIFTSGSLSELNAGEAEFKDSQAQQVNKWIVKVWPVINELGHNGITWDWINDASIQEAVLTGDKKINIRGNIYQSLVLADVPYIQMKSAEHISGLTAEGMNLIISGNVPSIQPSFLNWQENDSKTYKYLQSSLTHPSVKIINQVSEGSDWINNLKGNCLVRFDGKHTFIRQAQRELPDGSRIQFFWNKSGQWHTIKLIIDDKFKFSYWLNAEDGSIKKNKSGSKISYEIPPYSSVILFVNSQKTEFESLTENENLSLSGADKILTINSWDIKTDSLNINDSSLFDWKTKELWKYESSTGEYRAIFELKKKDSKSVYLLDLGEVYYTAELYVNGHQAGTRIYSPYLFRIDDYIKKGVNQIMIKVKPPLLNSFIGKANSGDKKYRQFNGKDIDLMKEGLLGPVILFEK